MKKIVLTLTGFLACLLITGQAYALVINPFSGDLNISRWEGVYSGQSDWKAALSLAGIDFRENQIFPGDTTASIAGGNYDVLWDGVTGVKVTFDSGTATDFQYLFVKDGNANQPPWYLFDLSLIAPTWAMAMDPLVLEDFWPEGVSGSISHISLHGEFTPVPEPATFVLLGFGLLGLAGIGRKNTA